MSFSQGHALLIGVGSYAHAPQLTVPITAAAAQALAAVLRDPVFCFDAGHGEGWPIMRLFKPGARDRRNPL